MYYIIKITDVIKLTLSAANYIFFL